MPSPLDRFLARMRGAFNPESTIGEGGTAVYGGYVISPEKKPELKYRELRYRAYSEILANTSIVAAGVRYFLNLITNAEWVFNPAEHPRGMELSEELQQILTKDPISPWHRIVRRMAMHRFYGFSVQEWIARRREDGVITFADVQTRAQETIEKWDVDSDGAVMGIVQKSPQDSDYIYIPRGKLVYLVDDSLNQSPEGLGLFRHLVEPAKRLSRYEQLEGFGFETDLRGMPIIRFPDTLLQQMVKAGSIDADQYRQLVDPSLKFLKEHIRNPEQGLMLDSAPYTSTDDAGRPSTAKQWDFQIVTGGSTSFQENAAAIERVNRELARILGVEQLLLGSDRAGSYALSRDKTHAFYLLVEGSLREIEAAVRDDLIKTVFMLNGWPEEAMPMVNTEGIRFADVEQIASTLSDMATAGIMLHPSDPAVSELFTLIGLTPIDPDSPEREEAADAALMAQQNMNAGPPTGGENNDT